MLLAELVCLSNQAQDHNGTILAGGRLYVYYKGRTALATTYVDPAGNVENTNPIILDNMGRCSVYASPNYSYTLVWCDMYGREKFSYDKDLLDPVPVEDTFSIGIKGDDTIQVNKSTSGQTVVYNLHAKGEDYNGIEPIVVNNDSREISANHKPLGVEAPLTFVQDDEEATIIGLDESTLPGIVEPIVISAVSGVSGQFVTSGYVESAISGKQDKLIPGTYIDIDGNTINVTGVQPVGSYATTQDFVNISGYINEHEQQWSEGTTYSSVSGTVQVSGNDLEIWNTGLRRDIRWETDSWIHTDGGVTAGNGGWHSGPNKTYRLVHILSAGQYTNPAYTGFSAELRQEDANYNVLSSTMIYGIFNPYEFTTVPGCDHCTLYYSGTSSDVGIGVSVLTSNFNYYTFTDEFAWKSDVPTKTDFSNLYENVAVHSGSWSEGATYTGAGVINVDNETHVISADLSNYYDKQTVDDHIASGTSGKQDTLSAGSNIQIQNNVISVTGEMGKVYSGENYVVVDNINDKIGLTNEVAQKLDDFVGQYNLSAGANTTFRVEGNTVYIDTQASYTPTYEPIIEDL
jgi:hypothetical protein